MQNQFPRDPVIDNQSDRVELKESEQLSNQSVAVTPRSRSFELRQNLAGVELNSGITFREFSEGRTPEDLVMTIPVLANAVAAVASAINDNNVKNAIDATSSIAQRTADNRQIFSQEITHQRENNSINMLRFTLFRSEPSSDRSQFISKHQQRSEPQISRREPFAELVITYSQFNRSLGAPKLFTDWLKENGHDHHIQNGHACGNKINFFSTPGDGQVDLTKSKLHKCDFTSANFSYVIIKGAEFQDSILRYTDLTHAEGLTVEQLLNIKSAINDIIISPIDEKRTLIRDFAKQAKEMQARISELEKEVEALKSKNDAKLS